MSECKLDHSIEDVQKKFKSQKPFLPEGLSEALESFLDKETAQEKLNEVFHLLKKYDLADQEERQARNKKLEKLITE
ncbi:hypothetical protein [Peribacillus sp. SCS-155]|uniref:hypothetical protein n=1 Tax=Peribacillus sedimenti TaxID=3115297 RepID=UPI003906988A